ncbi:MAG: 1,4-alpha-glucan branching protein GlgB [Gammaproteobacteria bacterium]|nr:1,4-alpha-glucan branching protein GlgB [Gammaproteobacteria bacterium]
MTTFKKNLKVSDFAPDLKSVLDARHHDPAAVLGCHAKGDREEVLAYLPGATDAHLVDADGAMQRVPDTDLFYWGGARGTLPGRYRLRWTDREGQVCERHDPYCFPPQLGDLDLHLFGEGRHRHAYRFLGAHEVTVDDVAGTLFAVWAPGAARVSVVGDFNHWDGRQHAMRVRGGGGIWELFVPGLGAGTIYKFEIRNRDTGQVFLKTDPYGQFFERRPATAAVVTGAGEYGWGDGGWLEARGGRDWQHTPMSIYEVHLGSWRHGSGGAFTNYRELAISLVDHVKALGFTHIELLPVTEHPLDASWGYQTTGYYAPTSRFGEPDDFRFFVDHCHQNGIGVLMDWAPAHFPRDQFALATFDGTALYEHSDPRRGEHRDWGTLIFNYGRNEVKNFLLSSAIYWLEEFHIDGLRVDAVASMLYLDYSREDDDWVPNKYGGNENLEAIEFLRELNEATHGEHPGTLMVAEESTAWPQVTRPVWVGGLGFSMKWNMGWMHDTLEYITKDPIHRHFHHDQLTFGLLYAFTENFVLPFSHDEVVHMKGSMFEKMPGDDWQRFANLRLLYAYMWTYPGKKLLFMGSEFAQGREWRADEQLDWYLLDYPAHAGMQTLVRDLNQLYRESPALHEREFEHGGFEWVDCHDAPQSTISYLRRGGDTVQVVVLNFTPVPRQGYRIGVPVPGVYHEVLNSDSRYYGGSDVGNGGDLVAEETPWMGRPYSLNITLPPLGAVVLRPAA